MKFLPITPYTRTCGAWSSPIFLADVLAIRSVTFKDTGRTFSRGSKRDEHKSPRTKAKSHFSDRSHSNILDSFMNLFTKGFCGKDLPEQADMAAIWTFKVDGLFQILPAED